MPPPPTRLRRDLRAILLDGAAFSVMVGGGETYLAPFVLAAGLGEVQAGFIASLPPLAGAVLQLASPAAVRRLHSHRRWVVLCALVQAASFLPLIVAALAGTIPATAAFLVATIYWGAGMSTGPAWNTWIGTLVPRGIRASYFARRTRITQIGTVAGLLAGGGLLAAGKGVSSSVEATGTLDTVRYGSILKPRSLIGVTGAGYSFDGYYVVSKVRHQIGKGAYSQSFTLSREGIGSVTPVVM